MARDTNRISYLKSLWEEGLWGKWITAACLVWSLFAFGRDELLLFGPESNWKLISLVPQISISTWATFTLVLLLAWIFEASYRLSLKDKARLANYEAPSPIDIVFDATNRQSRYWSLESSKNSDGTVSQYHRYSIAVKNTGSRTLNDVQVTWEMTGELSNRPSLGKPQIPQHDKFVLHPGDLRFVDVFYWPHPRIQAGMLANESAQWGYGKLKVSVSATDTKVVSREFAFDFTKDPMLSDPV